MRVHLFRPPTGAVSLDPARRGYHMAYREGEANRCPGCGRSHWHIGRLSAECAFCGTALPLTESLGTGAGLFRCRGRGGHYAAAA
jgi:uncharacterized protein (DUF983 family)